MTFSHILISTALALSSPTEAKGDPGTLNGNIHSLASGNKETADGDPSTLNGNIRSCATTLCPEVVKKVRANLPDLGNPPSFNEEISQRIESLKNHITGGYGKWIGGTWYLQNNPYSSQFYIGERPDKSRKNPYSFGIGIINRF